MIDKIELSPVARSLYGCTSVSEETITYYGYALITIASEEEGLSYEAIDWFDSYFTEMLFIPPHIAKKCSDFDYRQANLVALMNHVNFESSFDRNVILLYDAIRMAQAESEYDVTEIETIYQAGEKLGVPKYKTEALAHLASSQLSAVAARKAFFEVDYSRKPEIVPTPDNAVKHNSWVTFNFGHTYTTYDSLLNYCHLLLVLSGSGAPIAESQLQWLKGTCTAAGIPQTIIKTFDTFDYQSAKVEKFLSKLVTDTYQNLDRISIYLIIQMSRALGSYSTNQQEAIRLAARLLEVEEVVVDQLEHLIEAEEALENLRINCIIVRS